MVALTRIKNNQITDSTINAAAKVQSTSITGGLLANNLTYGSDLTVSGNLTVNGQTTTIDTNVTTIEDPVILLASTQTGGPTVDIGFIGERGSSDNIAFVWDESADEFVTAFTSTSETNTTITISSYASFKTLDAAVTGNLTVTGTTGLTGNLTLGNLSVSGTKTLVFGDNALGNVADPTLDTDAATKGYVDQAVSSSGFTVTDGVSNATIEGGDTIEFTGTASEITVTQSGNAAYAIFTFGLPNDVTISGNLLSNKIDSNTTITATGNLSGGNISTAGVIDATGTITGGNLSTAGTATVTGNITGGNLLTGGVVDATGTITGGNLSTAGTVNATGNITGGNLLTSGLINATGTITATGNLSGGNISTAGIIDATGTITGGNLSTAGTMTATGNVTGGNLLTGGIVDATGTITGGNLSTAGTMTATGNVSGGNVTTGGLISATGNVIGGNITTGGQVVATGNITGGNLITTGTFQSASISATGNITGGNITTTGIANIGTLEVTGTGAVTGNLSGGNLTTAGIANIGTLEVTGTGTVTGNLSGGNISTAGLISATGNITGGNLVTVGLTNTGTLQVSGNAIVDGNLVVNGNLSYINIDDLRVQDPIIVLGTGPNGAPLTTNDGLDRGVYMEYYTTGLGNAFMGWDNSTGNMVIAHDVEFTANDVVGVNTYGTLQAGNLYVESAVSVGNVTGGNINTAGQVVATGNITGGNLITTGTFESASISATGNITGGNLLTGGLINATGNVTGGNITTAGLVNATGNLQTGANIVATGYASITGNVTGGNINTAGVIDATGTITGGNLSTAGTVTATGNVSGGNITTAGQVVATGNITGGNINTAGKVAATGNLETGANVVATGYASITGNVTGGNLVTAGVIDATGTITGGNLSTAGTATATGNITGGNLITGGLISVTGNINGTGAVFSGNVTADTFIGNISGNIDAGGSNTNIQFNDGDLLAGSAAFTFDKTSNAVVASGNITGGNLITAGVADVTGNITGGNLVTAGLASVTGNVTGGNINTAGQVVATGNVTGGNVVATALVTGANVSATSNVSGANVVGTTSLTGGNIVISGDNITDTNGRVNFNTAGADVDFAVNGDTVANVFYVDAGTGTASFGSETQTTDALVAFNTTSSILVPVGNIGTRPGTGVTGMLRFNTTNNNMEVFDNTQWSAIGVPSFTVITNDSFAGDGTTVAFTLSESASTDSCIVSINGVVQIPTTAYSVSGTTLTFTEAPLTGDAIDVRILTTTTTVTSISNASGNAVVATLDTDKTVQITGDLLPAGNLTANLGSPTKYWKTLYVGGNTIYLGNLQLKAENGTMAFYESDGTTPAPISSGSVDTSLISSGTSSVAVIASGGNVRTNIAGATVQTISSTGVAITGDLSVTGNATLSGNILGDRIQNGTTQIDIQTQNGNANITVAGTANVAVFSSGGANITGTLGVTGNITGGNLSGTSIVGTLTTASQTNITSVGTLGSLTVTGNVSGGNVTTSGVFAGSGAQLTNIPGGNVSGTVATATTAGTVTTAAQPNITSVGTLSSLSVTANIAGGNVTTSGVFAGSGAQLTNIPGGNVSGTVATATTAGTVTTAAQPNITSVGTLSSLAVTGNITSGNLSGTSIVGTLTTAAQTNITSVGALNGGSITSGFGAIDIGTDTVTCGGIVNSNANGIGNIGSSTTYFNTVFAKATSAQYADLAEKYVADAEYPAGTVVVFGGDKEVTVTSVDADRTVAGVISTNPSYIMNGGLEAEFVATVALTGRVPCRVTGTVRKGDLMVSAGYGLARADADPRVGTVIGKALENFEGNEGVIEVVVGRF